MFFAETKAAAIFIVQTPLRFGLARLFSRTVEMFGN